MNALKTAWTVQKNKILLAFSSLFAVLLILFQSDPTIIQKYKHAFITATLPYCPYPPENLSGHINLNLTHLSYTDVLAALSQYNLQTGGFWKPKNCISKHHVAILIPYRNRTEHLKAFLLNMIPLFVKQQFVFKIYLIEPTADIRFNRGLLFNIGFTEANKDANWQCHVFHDVDLLLEDDRTLYTCPPMPTHLAHFQNKWNYTVHYEQYYGGATVMRKEHYVLVNGYSNLYFGWGREDDDHRLRIILNNLTIINPHKLPLGKYFMFKHERVDENPLREEIFIHGNLEKYRKEGLNSVEYKLLETVLTPLYTKFVVHYDEKEYMKLVKIGPVIAKPCLLHIFNKLTVSEYPTAIM